MTPFGSQIFRPVLVIISSTLPALCFASSPHEAFLQGLRDRSYFETALEYLDVLANDTTTADDIRTTLNLERAIIWMGRRGAARRPADREQLSERGLAAFETFLREHPQHSRAPFAHAQRGLLLLDRARRNSGRRESPADLAQREGSANAGRQILERAKQSFAMARDLYKAQLADLPFVTVEEDEVGYRLRQQTEVRFQQAWLSFVKCIYEEALTFDPDSERRSDLLRQASQQFEEIHTFNRKGAGLHAKLMMGKCLQELGDISQALGYFDEVRNQPAQDALTVRLSRTAQHYRLICLNHESRQEFQNVVTEATRWLDQNHTARNTEAGLGILYEKAVASEALARDDQLSDEQSQLRLRQALTDLEIVSTGFSPMRESARAAASRLRDELGQDRREPRKFEEAFDRGREIIGRLQEARDFVELAESDAAQTEATQQLELLESEAGRMFQLALKLRQPDSDRSAVAQARYLLSYVFLQQRKSYDAFVLARHVMRGRREIIGETAADASEMAISAAVQLWSAAPEDDRSFEQTLVREVCEEVVRTFPDSRPATAARMRLGHIHLDLNEPQQAAAAFLQVPPEDPDHAAARMEAGQAWWLAWAQASSSRTTDNQRATDPAKLEDWKQRARTLLADGIELSRAAQPDNSLSDDIVRAEVSLSGLLNTDGDFAETVQRLAHGSPTVLSAVESNGERPESGVKRAAFAGLCYRTLLRAYVGTQQIDDALQMMKQLQTLGESDTTTIYTQLGRELQQELARLEASGQLDRLQQVRTSFEQFLGQIYQSRDSADSGALLWIAESYAGLARGTKDTDESALSFKRAAETYELLLDSDLDDDVTTAVKLRLIRIYRQQEKFQPAVDLATDVLTGNSASVSVQLEAAHVLADWGEHGEPERLLDSIRGVTTNNRPKTIWGWAALARRLQRSRQQENWSNLKPLLLEARYELSHSRLRYARVSPDAGQKQLEAAARELTSISKAFNDLDDEWRLRFDGLFQDVQAELGRPALAMFRSDEAIAPVPDRADDSPADQPPPANTGDSDAVPKSASAQQNPSDKGRPDTVYLVLGIMLMGVVTAVVSYLAMRRPKERTRKNYVTQPTSFQMPGGTSSPTGPLQNPPRSSRKGTAVGRPKSQSRAAAANTDEKKRRPPRKPVSHSESSEAAKPRRKKRPQPPAHE
jgi:hypothetical protein